MKFLIILTQIRKLTQKKIRRYINNLQQLEVNYIFLARVRESSWCYFFPVTFPTFCPFLHFWYISRCTVLLLLPKFLSFPEIHRGSQWLPEIPRYSQRFPNILRIPTAPRIPRVPKSFQRSLSHWSFPYFYSWLRDLRILVHVGLNLSKLVQTCLKTRKLTQIIKNMLWLAKI